MDDSSNSSKRRQPTRVFKKSNGDNKITVYLEKRDFVDHITHVDPVDGVVLINPDWVGERKVYGRVLAEFKHGREDLDVLGINFRKELYRAVEQIYPVDQSAKTQPLTQLQERLMRKLGNHVYPFHFELPSHCPPSVTLQPAPGDTGKPCGVDYELKVFVSDSPDDQRSSRNTVRLAIRKIMYAPSKPGEQPSIEVSRGFWVSRGKAHLEASLDKALYHHGEKIAVNVHVANSSNRYAKKIKISVIQFADISLYSSAKYECAVDQVVSDMDCPIKPGFTLSKIFYLTPLLANNKHKFGLALDGQLKHEDTNLASSTLMADQSQRENYGIIVQYKVRVEVRFGFLWGKLVAELPFILMHPKPEEDRGPAPPANPDPVKEVDGAARDTNLIQLEEVIDDDFIFEDFARRRLKGVDQEAMLNDNSINSTTIKSID
ncbi:hypothetical protein QAD02_018911 [Eretmocerus hayati]|uniref:Uncharacterized protein n=1 Tax=Eretmocerus hayati TaxID=131215 RepID=A0ACC2PKL0_9HYME|nr:hypothetical protein QAD02_018911 [Eretmocerus hayati]